MIDRRSETKSGATRKKAPAAKGSVPKSTAKPTRTKPTKSKTPDTTKGPAASLQAASAAPVDSAATKPPHRIYRMTFASVYPHYLAKVERKGRTKDELDEVIRWLTGYTAKGLEKAIADARDLETFFAKAPKPNSARVLVTGTICGVRIESIEDALMREVRILDKLVDELAKGWAMEKVKRGL